jgi:hypothetical protein
MACTPTALLNTSMSALHMPLADHMPDLGGRAKGRRLSPVLVLYCTVLSCDEL